MECNSLSVFAGDVHRIIHTHITAIWSIFEQLRTADMLFQDYSFTHISACGTRQSGDYLTSQGMVFLPVRRNDADQCRQALPTVYDRVIGRRRASWADRVPTEQQATHFFQLHSIGKENNVFALAAYTGSARLRDLINAREIRDNRWRSLRFRRLKITTRVQASKAQSPLRRGGTHTHTRAHAAFHPREEEVTTNKSACG